MYEGNAVDLQMEKVIAADAILDDETHHCQVFRYDMEEDYIYLQLKEDDLTAISLDAKYQCYISTRTELLFCTGVVQERYQCEHGKILVFHIENGFYTISDTSGSTPVCKSRDGRTPVLPTAFPYHFLTSNRRCFQ